MPSPELAQQLADIGGFALFMFVVVVAAVGLFRRWWVPGWVYEIERSAREVADTQAERNALALEQISKAMADDRARARAGGRSGAPDDP